MCEQRLQILAIGDEYVTRVCQWNLLLLTYSSSEVVLAILLTHFKFEDTGKPVAWNSSAVMYPTMGEKSTKPELLLMVKAIKE